MSSRPFAVIAAVAVLLPAAAVARVDGGSVRLVTTASGFEDPVLVTAAPGEANRLYVVEQTGRVVVLVRGQRRTTPFLDIRSLVEYGGEQGLLGLAFHPKYASNRLVYVAYTSKDGRNVVARYRSNGTVVVRSSRKVLLAVDDPYGNHNGGHVAFGPDGRLYTSIGDGGAGGDPENRSQDMRSPFGKLLRLDVGKPSARWEFAALGLRNPWRFSFDRKTGDLWIGDVGQGEIEEIDYLARGSSGLVNFGWDVYEGSRMYDDKALGPGRLVQPVFEYDHDQGCSVTGGYVVRSTSVPALTGRYVFGDYCSGTIWSLRLTGGKATDVRREAVTVRSLTSFGEGPAGELYAVSGRGTVYRFAR